MPCLVKDDCAEPGTFRCNFELRCTESEKFSKRNIKGTMYREFLLAPMKHQFQPDLGWKVHAQFPGNFPCILGWVMKKTQPKGETTQHFSTASLSAKRRWAELSWPSSLLFFEDKFCLWPDCNKLGTKVVTCRILSPEEAEQLLGFPRSYTALASPDWKTLGISNMDERACKRRNAVGNGIAVPVLRRLLLGVLVSATSASASLPWDSHRMQRPYHTDQAWDVLDDAEDLASTHWPLISDFYTFTSWPRNSLVGPDPLGMGRLNRAHRKAALGRQMGCVLSKNAIEPLIPLDASMSTHVRPRWHWNIPSGQLHRCHTTSSAP